MAGSPPPGQNPGGYPNPPGGQQQPQQPQQPPPGVPGAPTAVPGAPFGIEPKTGLPYSDKQKLVAGLLQIFRGGFGVGRFYTGHTQTAVIQLIVTWVTCGLGGIWPFVDGIMILVDDNPLDANGLPLRP